MVSTNDFKTGITIEYEGEIYQVLEFLHVKPGKGNTFVRAKIKNLRTGSTVDYRFDAGIKIKLATIEKKPMQYLYADGSKRVFMDTSTYEQIEIEEDVIKNEILYIKESNEVQINFYGSEILGITLPDKVVLEVVDTISGVKGDNTKTNSLKDAVLETSLLVKVPMFIENGDKIIVSTWDGTYVSREK
ncbi:MAG: elongation factor P [Acholeplasmatales bacterium]|jgi:elongation factor P|nr:elongation factor P [Acholeplasmatales bacterium]